jgi:hypothetical protein
MARNSDVGPIDTRTVLDLAILVEEDAASRYAELAQVIGDDPGGAGDVCLEMAARERVDRERLAARRAALRDPGSGALAMPAGSAREGPHGSGGPLPATARAALEDALAGERRAVSFYAALAARAADAATAALLESLRAEEEQHVRLLTRKIADLDAAAPAPGLPCADPVAAVDAPPGGACADPDVLAEVLPRFDAGTQAVARALLLEGRSPDVVAWELGVTRRTVLRKLRMFLQAAPVTVVTSLGGAYAAGPRAGSYAST